MTANLEPGRGLHTCLRRMEIDEGFHHPQHLESLMDRHQTLMGKIVTLVLLTDTIGLWRQIVRRAAARFAAWVQHPVRVLCLKFRLSPFSGQSSVGAQRQCAP